jgi:hypothetical protein
MGLSKEQLRAAQEILEQWRRPSQRARQWPPAKHAQLHESPGVRPPASDRILHKLERALLHNYFRDNVPD